MLFIDYDYLFVLSPTQWQLQSKAELFRVPLPNSAASQQLQGQDVLGGQPAYYSYRGLGVQVEGRYAAFSRNVPCSAVLGGWPNNNKGGDIGRFDLPFIIAEEAEKFRCT